MIRYLVICFSFISIVGCSKNPTAPAPPAPPVAGPFNEKLVSINGLTGTSMIYNVPVNTVAKFSFTSPVSRSTVNNSLRFLESGGMVVNYSVSYENSDSTVVVKPSIPLKHLNKYSLNIAAGLQSAAGRSLTNAIAVSFATSIDSTSKFPLVADNVLLNLVQQQTFKYFWDFGHPVSGLARERSNGDNNVVTSGGSGFGLMAIITAVERNFITRAQGLARVKTMVEFLRTKAEKFHGAFPHWLHGETGVVIPFSQKDNGADLVETSYLVQGLLCARQYFSLADATEAKLRTDINEICNGVEWDWFRKNDENVLYWHWSPTFNWDMNLPIRGWNECLVTYILAASSTSHPVPPVVYQGWTGNAGFKNGALYYGYALPLGPPYGGPLFFSHYSFLGINPTGLTDQHANYTTQTKNHTLINYSYCTTNPNNYFGYSDHCWGLTASDIPNGYTASSPTNDVGVIAPTAALSSFPYTPAESMKALKFFYYTLGDKIWKEYGFVDAFALKDLWYADSFLAIDQGPIIVMIENYRSGLLWNLFTSCPEVKTGMRSLGFTAPYL